ncbi:porin [Pseudoduganella violaceinigra]|uniref:porin n=1 Tax=Pseudoduganella violaceinigra TaxID=246602 RepID=UPI0003FFDA0A|nr:porin [Pseudoduganella violaceinigra]
MKKLTLAALIIGAFAAQAQAQSNVTIYGIADAGFVAERGGVNGSVNKVTSGVGSASRLGFKGVEDLGGGTSAVFVIESGVKIDTGDQDTAGVFAQRQAYVGLKSAEAGQITLGRQYTMLYNALSQVGDPFGAGYAGSAKNLFPTGGVNTRASNTIVYSSPVFSGFNVDAMYGMGEQNGDNTAGRQFGLGLNYSQGPLNVRLVHNNKNNDVAAVGATPAVRKDKAKNTLLAANYDFGVAKAYFAYEKDKGAGSAPLPVANAYGFAVAPKSSNNSAEWLLGVGVPLGGGNLVASYIHKDDKQNNQDANQYAIGYLYALSKRTTAYTSIAKIKNKNGAGYTVGNNTEAGTGDKAFNLGLRHAF